MKQTPVLQKNKVKPTLTKNKKDYQDSDMVGMPGTAFRKKVEKEIKGKPLEEKGKMTKTSSSVKSKSTPVKMKKC